MRLTRILVTFFAFTLVNARIYAQSDPIMIKQFFDEALTNGKAYHDLEFLCKHIGARISGSPQAAAAVEWGRQKMMQYGFDTVYLQPVMVPRWIRGDVEKVRFISAKYGQVNLNVTSIGNTLGTGPDGVLAKAIEVNSRKELDSLGKAGNLKDRIVFLNVPMNQTYISSGNAYGESNWIRTRGAGMARKYQAKGVLIRSLSIETDNYPHTGSYSTSEPTPDIPAMALSTLDADKLSSLLSRDPNAQIYMESYCHFLPDVQSYNVIGEIYGSEHPEEIIAVGGHLDSWDIGEGASDDGTGVMHALEALRLFKTLNIRPNHTLRAIFFMNEENGLRGALKYAEVVRKNGEKHIAALESDSGGFAPIGFSIKGTPGSVEQLQSWMPLFEPYLIHTLNVGWSGEDVDPLQKQGAVTIGLEPEPQRYFGYHHSDADTFDKVNRRELEMGAAAEAALIYLIDKHGLPKETSVATK